MTTPEQLQVWRDIGHKKWMDDDSVVHDSKQKDCYAAGYLRAKQETEQAMKLAKFGAMVMDSNLLMCHDYGTINRAIEAGLLSDRGNDGLVLRSIEYANGIEAIIEDILK